MDHVGSLWARAHDWVSEASLVIEISARHGQL